MALTATHVEQVCRFGQGEQTCSYVFMTGGGLQCAKGTSVERVIAQRRECGQMIAKGDHCAGETGTVDIGDVPLRR